MEVLKEGDNQVGGVFFVRLQRNQGCTDGQAGQDLQREFVPCSQPQIAAVDYLNVVIGKANGSEGQRGTNRQPDEFVGEIGPQDGRNHDGNHNQHATHGGSTRFFGVRFGPFFADELSNLKVTELADDGGTHDHPHKKRGQAGKGGAKGEIAEDAEGGKVREQLHV